MHRSMATNLSAAGPHPPLLSHSPCLQKIHSVKYRQGVALLANSLHRMANVRTQR